MGIDKSMVDYHGEPQRYYLYDILRTLCDRVFISCNQNQSSSIFSQYEFIIDDEKHSAIGPMAGLLSAFEKFPSSSFLLAGCDYPFIGKNEISQLIESREQAGYATCFFNSSSQIKEPMLCIYESKCFRVIQENFNKKKYSLRHFLEEINANGITPTSGEILKSIDDPESFQRVKKSIRTTNEQMN